MYVLAATGGTAPRHSLQMLHEHDSCCFATAGLHGNISAYNMFVPHCDDERELNTLDKDLIDKNGDFDDQTIKISEKSEVEMQTIFKESMVVVLDIACRGTTRALKKTQVLLQFCVSTARVVLVRVV